MFTPLKIFLLLYCTRISTSNVLFQEIQTYHNETYYKAEHAYKVVTKIYNAFRQWYFTVTFCEFTYFENRILKYTENMDYGYPVLLLNGCPDNNRTRNKPRINIHGQTAYVITSNNLTLECGEYIIEALVRTGVFKPRSAVIFILNEPIVKDDYFMFAMKSHFQLLWSRSITNSIVMFLRNDILWSYTYDIFRDQIVDVTGTQDIHRVLEHQYDNLCGHELKLSVYTKAFMGPKQPPRCNSPLAQTVIREMNATCKAFLPRDGHTVGDLMSNGTATGVTADLMDGYTDLELSSRILKNSYFGYIDTTYPLSHDELCFVVKNNDRQSTFKTVINLITINMLITFMANFVGLISVALAARELESKLWNFRDTKSRAVTVLELIKCFIRQTVDITFPGAVYRFIIALIINYSLIIDCVIDAIITSAITYPRYRGNINTLQELFQSNLTLGIHNRHVSLFNRSLEPDNQYYESIMKRIEVINDQKNKEIIYERQFNYAVLMRKTEALYISNQMAHKQHNRPIFHIIPDCPVPCSIVYGLRYGSPYLSKVNDILFHLHQGGLLQYWAVTEQKGNQNQLIAENRDKPLHIGNVKEIFAVWLAGVLISVIVLFVEIIKNKQRKLFRRNKL